MVLPVDGAAGERRQPVVRKPGHLRDAALDAQVAARGPDEVEVLVEPDGDRRMHAQDQRVRDARLHLRERPRARVVDAPQPAPAVGEVAVEVDAVCVPAAVVCAAVGIQQRHDPEVEPDRRVAQEIARDRDPRGLAAVNAAHDEDGDAGRVSDLVRDDRPALHGAPRAARPAPPRRPGRGRSARQREQPRGADDARRREQRQVRLRPGRAFVHSRHFAVRGGTFLVRQL
jgi:hypothetical protein